MLTYLLKRVFGMIPLLVGITVISFAVIHLAPGNPVELQNSLNPKMTKESRERLIKLYGLDKPLYIQYFKWLGNISTLDFGYSFAPDHSRVIDKIKERIGITITINILSMMIIFFIGIPIGIICAVYYSRLIDKLLSFFVFIGFALPSFWVALLLMMFFGIKLGWLPISGIKSLNHSSMNLFNGLLDYAKHLVLPLLVSAIGGLAGISRYVRGNMVEVLKSDYILAAKARGLSNKRIYYKHALRNALLPVITILGLSVPGLIGGSVIFESIFGIPGMGMLFYQSVMSRDYPVIMGILTIGAVLTLIGNLLADIGYAIADPRVREN